MAADPTLLFIGYTKPQGEGFRITVSGNAVESGMLEGLFVHEMSPIYRMQTNHTSHNAGVIDMAVNSLGPQALPYDYQQRIVGELVNNIEDLYADDMAVRVMRGGLVSEEQLSRFFQDWVKDEPGETGDPVRDRWVNASIMANNEYFVNPLINLNENITPERYRNLLSEYLNKFLETTKMN